MSMILFLLTVCLMPQLVRSNTCPIRTPGCNCTYQDRQINSVQCVNLGDIAAVPRLNSSDSIIQVLEIKGLTTLKTVQANAFSNLKIRSLKLSSLLVETVDGMAFAGLGTHLESLYLNNNLLRLVPVQTFSKLTSLIYLHLDGNQLESVNASTFGNLSRLQHLYLQQNQLRDVPPNTFHALNSLVTLHMDNIQLRELPAGLFINLPQLEDLYLRNNFLKSVEGNPFQRLTALNWLILSKNQIDSLPSGLLANNARLKHLELDFNNITQVPIDAFSATTELQYLRLSFNRISTFHPSTFTNLNALQYLFLRDNLLTAIPQNAFENLNQLNTLDLQNNAITGLEYQSLLGLSGLQELYLQGNDITMISYGIFDPLTRLQILDLSQNRIQSAFHGPFDTLKNLRNLEISFNRLQKITRDWFQNLSKLKSLHINNNEISDIEQGTFDSLSTLEDLDVTGNRIFQIQDALFKNLTSLKTLKLRRNPLANITGNTLLGLSRVTELDLSNSCINQLSKRMFKSLTSLQVLYISYLSLETLPNDVFDELRNLTVLDISSCSLNHLPYGAYVASLQSLYAGNNPLNCTCDNAWLRSLGGVVKDLSNSKCGAHDQYSGSLILCYPQTNCSQKWSNSFEQLCTGNPNVQSGSVLPAQRNVYIDVNICDSPTFVETPVTDASGVTDSTEPTTREVVIFNFDIRLKEGHMFVSWDVTNEYANFVNEFNLVATSENGSDVMLTVSKGQLSARIPFAELQLENNYTVCISVILFNNRKIPSVSCQTIYVQVVTRPNDASTTSASTSKDAAIGGEDTTASEFPLVLTIVVAVAGVVILVSVIAITAYCCSSRNKEKPEKEEFVYPDNAFQVSSLSRNGSVQSEQLVEQSTLTLHPNKDEHQIDSNGYYSSK